MMRTRPAARTIIVPVFSVLTVAGDVHLPPNELNDHRAVSVARNVDVQVDYDLSNAELVGGSLQRP